MTTQLYNGDCLEVMKSMSDGTVDAIVTDPPFGIDYQSARRTDKSLWKPKIANDKTPYTAWCADAYRLLKDGGCLACFTRWDVEDVFRKELAKAGFTLKSQIIWDKVIHGMGDLKGDFAPCHENIIFAVKGRFIFPAKRPKSVIRLQRVTADKLVHPNEKPVELNEYLIEHLTRENETVCDLFLGSGTCGVAAKRLNRNFIGIELEKDYFNIAKKRIGL